MNRLGLLSAAGLVASLVACSSLEVAPPYVSAGNNIPKDQLAQVIVHNEADTPPSKVPYEWIASSYAVVTRLDYKTLGKSGAMLGSAISGDYYYPNEVAMPAGHHTVTVGVMTGCGLMEVDNELDAKAGVIYDVYGVFKSSYAVANGVIGGCQAIGITQERKPDD